MQVERVNVTINPQNNKNIKYLYNYALDFTNKCKVGGEFTNSHIKLNGVPKQFLHFLEELGIKFSI